MVTTIVAGSPLIPTKFIVTGLVLLSLLLLLVAVAVTRKFPYLSWRARFKRVISSWFFAILFFGAALFSLVAYWLVPMPNLVRSSVVDAQNVSLSQPIVFQFDRPVSRQKLEKIISPEVPGTWVFEQPLYGAHLTRRLVFYPQTSLSPDTDYQIQLSGITNTSGLSRSLSKTFSFKTKKAPELKSVSITEGEVGRSITAPIQVELTEANEGEAEFNFTFEPETEYVATLNPDKRGYTITFPKPLEKKMSYLFGVQSLQVTRDLETAEVVSREAPKVIKYYHFATGGELTSEEKFSREHPVYGAVRVIQTMPLAGATGVRLSDSVSVTFSQAVNHASAQQAFSITPSVEGSFEWSANILTFKPKQLSPNTDYQVKIASGVRGVVGRPSDTDFTFGFTTVSPVVKLGVPVYLQQHALSCEVATLRMLLSYRGVNVSEAQLLSELGVDPTQHVGSIWGDPNEGFVGNVDGRQMVDGYGVHWGPIARIGAKYRNTEVFTNATLSWLLQKVAQGNPAVVWGFSNKGISTTWYTPGGKQINAVRDEHTIAVVGFTGSITNPKQIIVNDPLVGQVYWTKEWFEKKWNIFNRSGVVVY